MICDSEEYPDKSQTDLYIVSKLLSNIDLCRTRAGRRDDEGCTIFDLVRLIVVVTMKFPLSKL
jgi:hypothetical protein